MAGDYCCVPGRIWMNGHGSIFQMMRVQWMEAMSSKMSSSSYGLGVFTSSHRKPACYMTPLTRG